jgi:hypothetical protein
MTVDHRASDSSPGKNHSLLIARLRLLVELQFPAWTAGRRRTAFAGEPKVKRTGRLANARTTGSAARSLASHLATFASTPGSASPLDGPIESTTTTSTAATSISTSPVVKCAAAAGFLLSASRLTHGRVLAGARSLPAPKCQADRKRPSPPPSSSPVAPEGRIAHRKACARPPAPVSHSISATERARAARRACRPAARQRRRRRLAESVVPHSSRPRPAPSSSSRPGKSREQW